MVLEESVLVNEVRKIFYESPKVSHYLYSAYININGEIISPVKVNGIHIVRDYKNSYADSTVIYLTFILGQYEKLYRNKSNINITLLRAEVGENSNSVKENGLNSRVYRGILIDKGNKFLEANINIMDDEKEANSKGLINVEFQLIDESVEFIRLKQIGTNLRNTSPGAALKTLFNIESNNLPLSIENKILGINMAPPDNDEVRTHILIPPIKLMELPNYLQKECGGIYSTDIGFYLQNNYWYIFPLFNCRRFENTRDVIHIFNIPPRRLNGVERTYRKIGNTLYIISTGDIKHFDDSESQQINLGNGVRFTDPGKMFEDSSVTENNRTTVRRGVSNTEFKFSDRDTGLNNVELSSDRYSSNVFDQTSKLSRRQGQYVQISWQNSSPELLKPGTPVKFYNEINKVLQTREGVVIASEHSIIPAEPGVIVNRHITNSAVTLFLEKD